MGGSIGVLGLRQTPLDEFDTILNASVSSQHMHRQMLAALGAFELNSPKSCKPWTCLIGIFAAAGTAIDNPFVEQTPDEFMNIQKVDGSSSKQSR